MNSIEKLEDRIKVIEETARLLDFFWQEYNGDTKKVVFKIAKDMLLERAFIIECEIARMKDVQYEGR